MPCVLVLGDVILDRYVYGEAERVSPEAPVLVVRADSEEARLGGAASVARLLRGLQAEVVMAGVVGDDVSARFVHELLQVDGIDDSLVLTDSSRPTTSKERLIGRAANRHPHQIVRIDREVQSPLDELLQQRLSALIAERLVECQAVLISDYAKGVCTPELLATVISMAKRLGLAEGRSLPDAIRLANVAAGLEVERQGVAPVSWTEILAECQHDRRTMAADKLVSLDAMAVLAESYRQIGRRIVFTNGCFNLLHVGHVSLLQEAARLGDVLVIAVNSDASVRRLKGPSPRGLSRPNAILPLSKKIPSQPAQFKQQRRLHTPMPSTPARLTAFASRPKLHRRKRHDSRFRLSAPSFDRTSRQPISTALRRSSDVEQPEVNHTD